MATTMLADTATVRSPRGPVPWVVYGLIVANLAAFVVELACGVSPTSPTGRELLAVGGNFAPQTLGGEPWRLLIAMFLHAGVLHVALNMFCLFQMRAIEPMFGRVGFGAVYLVAGLAGGVATLLRSAPIVSVGASGAVFGLCGAFLAFLLIRRRGLDPLVYSKGLRWVGTFIGLNVLVAVTTPNIDVSAHIGGLLGGGAIGTWLVLGAKPGLAPAAAQRRLVMRAIGGGLVAVVLALAATFVLPSPPRARAYAWLGQTGALVDRFYVLQDEDTAAYQAAALLPREQVASAIEQTLVTPLRAYEADLAAATVPTDQLALFDALRRTVAAQRGWYEDVEKRGRLGASAVSQLMDTHMTARDAAAADLRRELERLAAAR